MPTSLWQTVLRDLLFAGGAHERLSCSMGSLPLFMNSNLILSCSTFALVKETGHGTWLYMS